MSVKVIVRSFRLGLCKWGLFFFLLKLQKNLNHRWTNRLWSVAGYLVWISQMILGSVHLYCKILSNKFFFLMRITYYLLACSLDELWNDWSYIDICMIKELLLLSSRFRIWALSPRSRGDVVLCYATFSSLPPQRSAFYLQTFRNASVPWWTSQVPVGTLFKVNAPMLGLSYVACRSQILQL